MPDINIKRVYEPANKSDGFRILVDRLWPRGIVKEDLPFDTWLKEIAPSTALRKWFNHEPAKWELFKEKYLNEIGTSAYRDELIKLVKQHKTVTLLYSAKDEQHNQAAVLKAFLENRNLYQ